MLRFLIGVILGFSYLNTVSKVSAVGSFARRVMMNGGTTLSRITLWNCKIERASLARIRLDPDLSAVELDNLLA